MTLTLEGILGLEFLGNMTSFGRPPFMRAFYFPFLQPRHSISLKFEAYIPILYPAKISYNNYIYSNKSNHISFQIINKYHNLITIFKINPQQ